jgi:hypothetical protein
MSRSADTWWIAPSVVSITVDARSITMGFACRRYLLDRDDTLWRLTTTKFERMLRDPANHCLPVFAGQRARMADVIVELIARDPVRVVCNTFSILTFDAEGRLDPGRFEDDRCQTVVNATARFVGVPLLRAEKR